MFEYIPKGKLIMTPDDPFFGEILHSEVPPGWVNEVDSDFSLAFGVRENGLLAPLSISEEWEYLNSGEFEMMSKLALEADD